MSNISFKVDARTARLLGRENVVNENSAIIELIKNTYDADSDFCYLIFNINFEEIPKFIDFKKANDIFSSDEIEIIENYYVHSIDNAGYMIKQGVNLEEISSLFLSKNSILCIDNGVGMDSQIIEDYWMKIGTGNKQKDQFSPEKNRVRTGAKGVGRFALDRLGTYSKMSTCMRNQNVYRWELDWSQFDNTSTLDEVSALLEENENVDFENHLKKLIVQSGIELSDNLNYGRGTIIQINNLRDFWNQTKIDKLISQVKTLFPFGLIDKFNIKICRNKEILEDTLASQINNYDYKLSAKSQNGELMVSIKRNEFEERDIPPHIFNNEFFKNNFSKEKILGKEFTIKETNSSIVKYYKKKPDYVDDIYNSVGDFSFDLYFMKKSLNEEHSYYYKKFASLIRTKLLATYGGIKLYRDNFRVRPYGEIDSTSYDWLGLGARKALSPSSISHSGKWKVAPAQVLGAIQISRITNPYLIDQSNREGIMQNDYFIAFQQIILGIISYFEIDRQLIVRIFRQEQEKIETKSNVNIEDSISDAQQYENSSEKDKKEIAEDKKENVEDYLKTIAIMNKEIDKKNDQLRTLKAMGGTAVIANTFLHSLKDIKACIGSAPQQIITVLKKYLNIDDFTEDKVVSYKNPFSKVNSMVKSHEQLEEWVGLMVNALTKEKKPIAEINFTDEVQNTINLWKETIKQYGISINDIEKMDIVMHISPMDINSIFNNLIANSVYALNSEEKMGTRSIQIDISKDENNILIIYSNNGPPIAEKYKENPNLMFEAGDSTKENGTGMGMWIIYNTIKEDYNGDIVLYPDYDGFKVKIIIPYK